MIAVSEFVLAFVLFVSKGACPLPTMNRVTFLLAMLCQAEQTDSSLFARHKNDVYIFSHQGAGEQICELVWSWKEGAVSSE